jgi:hypothetical protein
MAPQTRGPRPEIPVETHLGEDSGAAGADDRPETTEAGSDPAMAGSKPGLRGMPPGEKGGVVDPLADEAGGSANDVAGGGDEPTTENQPS